MNREHSSSGNGYPRQLRGREFRPAVGSPQGESPVNVGLGERLASCLAGAGLAVLGLKRRSLGGLAAAACGGALVYRGLTGHCPLFAQLGVDTARRHPAIGVRAQHGCRIQKTVRIDRSPEDLYRFWRKVENLPKVMRHLVWVDERGGDRSHWVARGPFGTHLEWEAEIVNDKSGRLIAWRSIPGGDVDTAGSVHFDPAPGGGTRLRVSLKYDPPGGKAGAGIASLLGEGLERHLEQDLQQFKRVMEAGAPLTAERFSAAPPQPPSCDVSLPGTKPSEATVSDVEPLRPVWHPPGETDLVDEASMESFPSSDAPSFTGTTAIPGRSEGKDVGKAERPGEAKAGRPEERG